jgi:hypothetical protein
MSHKPNNKINNNSRIGCVLSGIGLPIINTPFLGLNGFHPIAPSLMKNARNASDIQGGKSQTPQTVQRPTNDDTIPEDRPSLTSRRDKWESGHQTNKTIVGLS